MKPLNAVYFDNAATTPLDPEVARAMAPLLCDHFGNPSSMHQAGRQVREMVEEARRKVAQLIQAAPEEIIFTSSGTEADNLALIGSFEAARGEPFHLITSRIEHPAILETCRYLEQRGAAVTYLGVDQYGMVAPDDLENAIRPDTRLVSIMTANNVVGTIQPIGTLAVIARQRGVFFHTDAVQAAGRIPLDLSGPSIDLLSLSSHKIYGPKGMGALFVRKNTPIQPILHGGGQESGLRSSTENVAGIVGLGKAAELAGSNLSQDAARLVQLRVKLIQGACQSIPNAYLIGHPDCRLPGHVCLGFSGQEGEAIKLLLRLDQAGFAISAGSACSARHVAEPSYILRAMGFDPFQARGGLRITLGRFNTESEVERFLAVLPHVVAEMNPIVSRKVSAQS